MQFTIGTDAEFFLMLRTLEGNKPISAIPFIGDEDVGTKYNPIRTELLGPTVQRDNVLVEFATIPVRTLGSFKRAIADGFRMANEIVKDSEESKRIGGRDSLFLSSKSSEIFDASELKHPEARQFGCEPDYNAWSLMENPSPKSKDPTLRTAGGHIHVGHRILNDPVNKIRMIRMMDYFIGIPSVLFDSSKESQRRRELYGKAGAYRPTPYGVEYRVLSNYWTTKESLIEFVYKAVRFCLRHVEEGTDVYVWNIKNNGFIAEIINDGNSIRAKRLMRELKFDIYLPKVI